MSKSLLSVPTAQHITMLSSESQKEKRKTKKRKENLSFFTQIKRKVLLKWLSIGGAQETKLLSAGIVLNLRFPPRCLKYVLEAMTVGVVAGVFLSLLS